MKYLGQYWELFWSSVNTSGSYYGHNESLMRYRPHCTDEGTETQNYSQLATAPVSVLLRPLWSLVFLPTKTRVQQCPHCLLPASSLWLWVPQGLRSGGAGSTWRDLVPAGPRP